jgi:class 3 adenylate cyclase
VADDTKPGAATTPRGADLRTFLIADIRGYTSYTREFGDDAASELARWFAAIVREAAPPYEGELLELRGDEAMCVFTSGRQALRAAVEIQRRLRAPDEGDGFPLGVGIGLDAGEAVPTEGGYRGSGLNRAARLCSAAAGGEIVATDRLVGLTGPVPGLRWDRPRALKLKGIPEPERVVRVEPDEPLPPAPMPPAPPRSRRTLLVAGGVALAVVAVVIGIVVTQQGGSGAPAPASVPVSANSLAVIDPAQHRVTADVRLAAQPESVVIGGRYAWVGGVGGTVTPIALTHLRRLPPVGVQIDPAQLAYGDGTVWVFDAQKHLAGIDAQPPWILTGPKALWHCAVVAQVVSTTTSCQAGGLAFVNGQVWVGNDTNMTFDHGVVERVDPGSLKVMGQIPNGDAGILAAGQGQVWLLAGVGQEIRQIDPSAGKVVQSSPLGVTAAAYTGGGIAQGFGAGWAIAPSAGWLIGFQPGQSEAAYRWKVQTGLTSIATGGNSIWLGVGDGRVLQVNPFSGKYKTYHLGHNPVAIAYNGGRVWVAVQ